ncbi:MAG: DNA-formamidopyrimidine glycosylase family protein [Ilumatobacter sp.]|uniref:DNA-formamidopyrimidine glycosylase family protein n=1 Tax=Ilumatobacter sp. TaxID=1967498 RepID=UPI0026252FCB|nr:DNA-formamidopyrimidine glycosylase family protein [Ilumatobacter sp.]MDJ0770783.1 DNA-formamidopyrimidine glycosylase family protein [Ilumatobacter sp.]
MPEGDTLRRLATRIDDRFGGDVVTRCEMRDPRLALVDLSGRRLVGADAYGKHLFVRFDDGRSLHAHLRMSGSFEVGRPSREPTWKRRAELWLTNGRLTAVDVPVLDVLDTDDEHTVTDRLGPDLCAPDGAPDPDEIAVRLVADPEAPLTGALLDQHRVAGFGNIYVNDVPFIVGVSPFQPVGAIDGLSGLVAIGVALIRTNAERGPQNTTGRRLGTDARWVHGAGRRPCPVCGGRLRYQAERETPWGRSITWCPDCQRSGDRVTADLERARRLIALHPATKQAIFPRR